MFIAILADSTNVRAYPCNGTVDEGTLDAWFEGSWDGSGPVTLRAAKVARTFERSGEGYTRQLPAFTAAEPRDEAATIPDSGEIVDRYAMVLDDGDIRGLIAPIVTTRRFMKRTRVDADGTNQQCRWSAASGRVRRSRTCRSERDRTRLSSRSVAWFCAG
jgi:hypothetical protein